VLSLVTGFLATIPAWCAASSQVEHQHRGARTTRLRRPPHARSSCATGVHRIPHPTFV